MSMISASPTWWMLLSILLTLLLVLVMGAVTWSFDLRRARLPAAVRWEDLNERNASIEVRIQERGDVLNDINQKIQDRDRIAAEVAALVERLNNLRVEIDSLTEAERQVELMKHKAAETAEQYALEHEKLDAAQKELGSAEGNIAEARQRLLDIEKQIGEREREVEQLGRALPTNFEEMKAALKHLEDEKSALDNEIANLKGERGALFAARDEVTALSVQKARLEQETTAQRKQLEEIKCDAAIAPFEEERARIIANVQRLQAERANLDEQNEQARKLTATVAELSARKVALEEDNDRLRVESARLARGPDPATDEPTAVEDLVGLPVCLKTASLTARSPQTEEDALGEVQSYLATLGLKYNKRTIYSFHTALKINESSQMTVLAGVSGTGKSLLPRRYAEAMGLHFLQIAVEPRWDSPQDLLGFYNYIEKRYRGTELARALVHMDPFNTSGLADEPYEDHVLLVLLDEMNLARVEYYFSEFLSRLELRPNWKDTENNDRRAGACLPIDIRGRKQGPLQLFPSHNVLFAGTMNDDESTQSLSDKVLDRSNVMQFAAPESFAKPAENRGAPVASGYRSHKAWRSWIKSAEELIGGERGKAEGIINQLAGIMERCGRPFGHRLNEAILTYVANYPRHRNDTVDNPLADQIEFRILPKLRGVTIEEHQELFADLTKLIHEELRDHRFSQRFDELVERQRAGSGQFNWRGLTRDQD
jgi:biopolymer transport protein ExbD